MRMIGLMVCWVVVFCGVRPAEALELAFPLACEIGKDCWIQQYVDHDATDGAKDYKCGGESYDRHDGTDFRALNAKANVAVLAAAAGTVIATRDGVEDHLANTPDLLRAVLKIECGNGVVLAHEGGYQTQYCHMRKGSVAVKTGDTIAVGTPLGKIGYSGAAQFAHLHFLLRKNAQKLDPFTGPLPSSCGVVTNNYWSAAANQKLAYHDSDLLELGWSPRGVSLEELELGEGPGAQPNAAWPELVVYMRAINLKAGDELRLQLVGPTGPLAQEVQILNHDKAEYAFGAKAKSGVGKWPAGRYHAQLQVVRHGSPTIEKTIEAVLN